MPRIPGSPSGLTTNTPPTDLANFLLAAADLHSSGEFQSAPVPTGKALQTGRKPSRSASLQIVK